jgi:hypothetical protein
MTNNIKGMEAVAIELFGDPLPPAVIQILQDASEDRTFADVHSELRSLAAQVEEANRV